MVELSEFFSGDKPLARIKKNPKLQDWFTKSYLKKMTRIAMVREDVIGTISIVSDFIIQNLFYYYVQHF